jgi:hypothetical protein
MSNPQYAINDVVYLRESAALGYIEAVRISGVANSNGSWIYTVSSRISQPRHATVYGDRISFVNGATLYFTEDEFVTLCEALNLAEDCFTRALAAIQTQKATYCGTE